MKKQRPKDVSSGTRYFYFQDGLGSVSEAMLADGTKAEQYIYTPFGTTTVKNAQGQTQNGTQIGNPYAFTGRRLDYTTGLYYYRARTYSPDLGRFLQRDPLGYVDGMNLYGYVLNNPATWVDPFGKARQPGKTPPNSWPPPPKEAVGKKPRWDSRGFYEGKGRRVTWDNRSHGTGADRGAGPQPGHWDDECSDNRWDEHGRLLPGSPDLSELSLEDWQYWEELTGLTGTALAVYLIISVSSRFFFPPRNLVPVP